MSADGLRASEEKMRAAGVPDVAIATFRHYYEQLAQGASGPVPGQRVPSVARAATAAPGRLSAAGPSAAVAAALR